MQVDGHGRPQVVDQQRCGGCQAQWATVVTGVVGVEGSTSCSKRGERTESVNECARSPAVKIGGTVGDASGDGQCDHKPARFATYHLAVTEHTVGELPELTFRSLRPILTAIRCSSEDSLHGGGREWRHAAPSIQRSKLAQVSPSSEDNQLSHRDANRTPL